MSKQMEDVNQKLNDALQELREAKLKAGYGVDLQPKVVILIRDFPPLLLDIPAWRDGDEKRLYFSYISKAAKDTNALAVVTSLDARFVDSTKFSAHFGIEQSKDFLEEYQRIMADYDYQMSNLPRELWTEALVVTVKGPAFGTQMRMMPYEEGPNGTVNFLPAPPEAQKGEAVDNLIEQWWDEPAGKVVQ